MDWNDLRYLLAVHRTGSLAKAAEQLSVTKATASRRLQALEAALGARLMERRSGGLVLTPAGHDALLVAERMEREAANLVESADQASDRAPQGRVKLTAPPWLAERFFVPALPELRRRYPDLEVELKSGNQLLNLAQGEADLAVRNVRPVEKSLVVRTILSLGGRTYASTLYLERNGVPSSRALTGHDVLVYAGLGGMPGFEWLNDTAHGGRIVFHANDPVALTAAAAAGMGLGAVPCLLGDANPALRRVEALGYGKCDMFLVLSEQNKRLARVRAVADFVMDVLGSHRAVIEAAE